VSQRPRRRLSFEPDADDGFVTPRPAVRSRVTRYLTPLVLFTVVVGAACSSNGPNGNGPSGAGGKGGGGTAGGGPADAASRGGASGHADSGVDGSSPPPLTGVTAIAAAANTTCAVIQDGTVDCWGYDNVGQLGNGTSGATVSVPRPAAVPGLSGVTGIAMGGNSTLGNAHVCVIGPGGTVQCWGDNSQGQLGDGTHTNSSSPVSVPITGVTALTASEHHTCALLSDGTVQCWGYLISNHPLTIAGPTGAGTLSNVTGLAAGTDFTCALLAGGTVDCWGSLADTIGPNSTPTPTIDSTAPTPVSGVSGVAALVAGRSHICALLSNQTIDCWGDNVQGELGTGNMNDSPTPVPVPGLTGVTVIAAGSLSTCAALQGSTVDCWGVMYALDLAPKNSIPTLISRFDAVIGLAAGAAHGCALLQEGTVSCWGSNGSGQLGNDTTTSSFTPLTVLSAGAATRDR
jgi:alpha-tubulin suppressor-like RCC1 family protein